MSFWSNITKPSPMRTVLITTVPALVLLTVLGPFETYADFDFAHRFAYWAAMLLVCGPFYEVIISQFLNSPKLAQRLSRWPRFGLGVLTGSFFAFWMASGVSYLSRGPLDTERTAKVFIGVLTIGTAISYFRFMFRASHGDEPALKAGIAYDRIAFFDAHPHLKGSRIRWITMQDHYARVVLEDNETSIHASMNDLNDQLKHYPGSRIHRSHWVAHDAIRGIKRVGRSTQVEVADDVSLPVGSSYLKAIARLCADR